MWPRFHPGMMKGKSLEMPIFLLIYHEQQGDRDYKARALRALGLLLANGTPTVGGGRLFDGSAGFFYGNSCNSGTESRKMVSKVGN